MHKGHYCVRRALHQKLAAAVATLAMLLALTVGCTPAMEEDGDHSSIAEGEDQNDAVPPINEELAGSAVHVVMSGALSFDSFMRIAENELAALVDTGCLTPIGLDAESYYPWLAVCAEDQVGCGEIADQWVAEVKLAISEPSTCAPELVTSLLGAITTEGELAAASEHPTSVEPQAGKFGSSTGTEFAPFCSSCVFISIGVLVVLYVITEGICCLLKHYACHTSLDEWATCTTGETLDPTSYLGACDDALRCVQNDL